MKEFWNIIQLAFAAIGGWLGWFLGGCDGLLYVLVALTVLDYISGTMCAIADKRLSSAVGFRGICRKVLTFMLVGVGHMLDVHIIGSGSVLRTATIFYFASNQGLSLLENAAYLGLPIPRRSRTRLNSSITARKRAAAATPRRTRRRSDMNITQSYLTNSSSSRRTSPVTIPATESSKTAGRAG